jgi:hypothetical protein
MSAPPLAIALALLAAGCAEASGAGMCLPERLDSRERLVLQPDSRLGFAVLDRHGAPLPGTLPSVAGGEVILRANGRGQLVLEHVAVGLTDLAFPENAVLPGTGLVFTDVAVALPRTVVLTTEWDHSGTAGRATGRGEVELRWSVVPPQGDAVALSAQRVRELEFVVEVGIDGYGQIGAEVWAAVDGPLWNFHLFQVSDLAMALDARQSSAAEPIQ